MERGQQLQVRWCGRWSKERMLCSDHDKYITKYVHMFSTLFSVSESSFAKLPFDSSSTAARIQISVNGGLLAGGFASCFSVGPGVACGAVSAVIVTAVEQMYEVGRVYLWFRMSCLMILRFTLTSSLLHQHRTRWTPLGQLSALPTCEL
jgi:hypothetical protein